MSSASAYFDGTANVLLYDGTDQDVLGQPSPYSLLFWALIPSVHPASFPRLVAKSNAGNSRAMDAHFDGASNTLYFQSYQSASVWVQVYTTGAAIDDGKWHHWAFVRGSSAPELYKDGVDVSVVGHWSTADFRNNSGLFLGRDDSGTHKFTGNMSHFQVHNVALSVEQIVEIMHRPAAFPTDRVIWLPLYGTDYRDMTGRGNDGTGTNMAASSDGPPIYQS